MGMGTGMGMVNRKWEGNGNSSLEEIPVSRVNDILSAGSLNNNCYFFIAILRDLTVLWLTRELACLYFVADTLHITILLIWHWTVFDAFMVFREWFGREWDEVAEFMLEWE